MTPARLKTLLKNAGRRRVTVVRLFTMSLDEADGDKLGEWSLSEPTEEDRQEVVSELWSAAQNDCDVRGEPAKYRVRMSGAGGEEIKQWAMKQLPDPGAVGGDELTSEPNGGDAPNGAGLVAMSLRHSNESVKLLISTHTQALRMLQSQLESAHKEIEKLRRRESDVMDLYRTVVLRSAEGRDDERTGERIDRGIALLARFAGAAGQELGVLPKGFDLLTSPDDGENHAVVVDDSGPSGGES